VRLRPTGASSVTQRNLEPAPLRETEKALSLPSLDHKCYRCPDHADAFPRVLPV
jgi:hypothetical protein